MKRIVLLFFVIMQSVYVQSSDIKKNVKLLPLSSSYDGLSESQCSLSSPIVYLQDSHDLEAEITKAWQLQYRVPIIEKQKELSLKSQKLLFFCDENWQIYRKKLLDCYKEFQCKKNDWDTKAPIKEKIEFQQKVDDAIKKSVLAYQSMNNLNLGIDVDEEMLKQTFDKE